MHFSNENHKETVSNFVYIVSNLYHMPSVYSVTTVAPFPVSKASVTFKMT